MMRIYGIRHVRGGAFPGKALKDSQKEECQRLLDVDPRELLPFLYSKQSMKHAGDAEYEGTVSHLLLQCWTCRGFGHMQGSRECPAEQQKRAEAEELRRSCQKVLDEPMHEVKVRPPTKREVEAAKREKKQAKKRLEEDRRKREAEEDRRKREAVEKAQLRYQLQVAKESNEAKTERDAEKEVREQIAENKNKKETKADAAAKYAVLASIENFKKKEKKWSGTRQYEKRAGTDTTKHQARNQQRKIPGSKAQKQAEAYEQKKKTTRTEAAKAKSKKETKKTKNYKNAQKEIQKRKKEESKQTKTNTKK